MARYADRLLADGEQPVLRTRQHWVAPLLEGRTAIAIFVAAVVLLVLNLSLSPGVLRDLIGYFAAVLLIGAIAWFGWILIAWYSEDYMVTNRRVIKVDGILRKRSADSSLEKINDAVLDQSVLGRMLGYGDLQILTAADTEVDHYRFLDGAPGFKRTMLDEKHRLEQEVYDFPGPPLRAAPPAAPAAPAAAVATAAAPAAAAGAPDGMSAPDAAGGETQSVPAHSMSSEEITRALGNLADLRDRGAITPEEFEAKKQELLGRL